MIIAFVATAAIIFYMWDLITSFSAANFDYEWFTTEFKGANISTFVQSLLYLGVYVVTLKNRCLQEGINKFVFSILLMSVFVNGMSVGMNLGRMTIYYNVFSILSIPISLKYIKAQVLKYAIGFAILMLQFAQMIYGSNHIIMEKIQYISLY